MGRDATRTGRCQAKFTYRSGRAPHVDQRTAGKDAAPVRRRTARCVAEVECRQGPEAGVATALLGEPWMNAIDIPALAIPKVALVTGGSSGIGKATAARLAAM